MLSVEQIKYQSGHVYRNGMLNIAWVAGLLRHARKTEGFIQLSSNLNQMIHFRCEKGVTIPGDYQEGQPIKIRARMLSSVVDGKPTIVLEVKRFETPTYEDMPPRKAFEQALREGVPRDEVRPPFYKPEKLDGWRVNDTGNMAKLAGFCSAFAYEKPRAEGSGGCVVIHLRQSKDERDLLLVRASGRRARSLYESLEVGAPMYLQGKIEVMLKNTGEPAGEDGILPTHRYQYLKVRSVGVPGIKEIVAEPDWVQSMISDWHAQRQQRREAAKARVAEIPATVRLQHANAPVAETAQRVATAHASVGDGMPSPEMLDLLRKSAIANP